MRERNIDVDRYRQPDHPVETLIYQRWSPRAMSGERLSKAELMRLFEAARWAPSSFNEQPWRFVYAGAGQRLCLGARGVSGDHGPTRAADEGRAPPARRGVPRGGRRDPRTARHAVADHPAGADGRVGISPEGTRGARVRDPEQAGRGEEARPVHPPASAGVGAPRRLRRGRGQAARAASVQGWHVVHRQTCLNEAVRHVGRHDGLPAGAGPCRRGEDQADP